LGLQLSYELRRLDVLYNCTPHTNTQVVTYKSNQLNWASVSSNLEHYMQCAGKKKELLFGFQI